MIKVGFFKGQPTEYVIKYVGGRVRREGLGLSFFYLAHNTQVVTVPTSSADVNFVFNEVTSNFQSVTIQGQFTYRVLNPQLVASLLNYTIDPVRRAYVTEDPDHLPRRITNVIQMETRREIRARSLEEALRDTEAIAASVQERIRTGGLVETMGVELINVYFLAAKPTPEVGKALEAEYRETLLRKADESIYARRAAAVEEERKIKENELNTQITLEEQRKQLIELEGGNAREEAQDRGEALELEAGYKARAMETELGAFRDMDPRTILALAMKELGQNADHIGNLTITSEILSTLLNSPANGRE